MHVTVVDEEGNPVFEGGATVGEDGTWELAIPEDEALVEGDYTVEAEITDEAGNTTESEGTLAVDTTDPALSVDDQVNNDTTPTITGTTDEPAGGTVAVMVTDDDGSEVFSGEAVVEDDGSWRVEIPEESALEDSEYGVTAEITDEAGNQTEQDAQLVVVHTDPVLGASITVDKGELGTKPHAESPLLAKPGENLIYTMRITNVGTTPADQVRVNTALPGALVYASGQAAVNAAVVEAEIFDGRLAIPVGYLDVGEAAEVQFQVRFEDSEQELLAGTTMTLDARVTYRSLLDNVYQVRTNEAVVEIQAVYGVSMEGGGLKAVPPGGRAVLSYTMENRGNDLDREFLNNPGMDVHWHYDLEETGSFTEDDPAVAVDPDSGQPLLGVLAPGESHALLAVVDVPDTAAWGERHFQVTAQSQGDAGVTAAVDSGIVINDVAPSLAMGSGADGVYVGANYTLQLDYGNVGTSTLTNAALVVELDDDVTFVNGPGAVYNEQDHTVAWNLDQLPPETEEQVTLTVQADAHISQGAELETRARILQEGAALATAEHSITAANEDPSFLEMEVNPDVVVGDGESQADVWTAVTDLFGNPVPDGVEVEFATERGWFTLTDGTESKTITVATADGEAAAVLTAPQIESTTTVRIPVTITTENRDTGIVSEQVDIT